MHELILSKQQKGLQISLNTPLLQLRRSFQLMDPYVCIKKKDVFASTILNVSVLSLHAFIYVNILDLFLLPRGDRIFCFPFLSPRYLEYAISKL
jgi:hypothetical protein